MLQIEFYSFSSRIYFLVFFVSTIILLVICVACAKNLCKIPQQALEPPKKKPSSPKGIRRQPRQARVMTEIQLAMCPDCEATILAEASVCPHCNTPRPVCMVCHHPIQFADSILLCPYCKGEAHRIHILEYLKVKGKCPHCQADLDEHTLISQ